MYFYYSFFLLCYLVLLDGCRRAAFVKIECLGTVPPDAGRSELLDERSCGVGVVVPLSLKVLGDVYSPRGVMRCDNIFSHTLFNVLPCSFFLLIICLCFVFLSHHLFLSFSFLLHGFVALVLPTLSL
uniref:T. congolense-specific, cell surface-expressed gene family n=1 Tax=Trypanosoma congolense (strain IL3000) TaxID=1068625 RepID=G0UUP9_TRYCI|nr:hypothetical protein, unlikely [Trypanosoma congolense IL3000]